MIIELIVGAAVAGGTFAFAKRKKASTGQSVAAAAVTGIGSAAATAVVTALFWPLVLIGTPVAIYYTLTNDKSPKALPPSGGAS